MKFASKLVAIAAAGIGLVALSAPAQALTITPATVGIIPANLGSSNCEPACVYAAFGLVNDGSLTLLYKRDVPGRNDPIGVESGTFAGSYDTVFANTSLDPQDATISYTGGAAISCGVCYLVIKDGNQNPSYYFFNLTAAGWNGTDPIILEDFWPNNGAISHVAIWGASETSVPEPGSLGLLGLGLAGMGIGMRRRRKQ